MRGFLFQCLNFLFGLLGGRDDQLLSLSLSVSLCQIAVSTNPWFFSCTENTKGEKLLVLLHLALCGYLSTRRAFIFQMTIVFQPYVKSEG